MDLEDINLLKTVILETKEAIKKRMEEEGPSSIPSLLMMIKMNDLPNRKEYLGIVVDPEKKEEAVQGIIRKFNVEGYGLIIHANSWQLDKDEASRFEDYEIMKKKVPHKDSLIVVMVLPSGDGEIVSAEEYTEVGRKLIWKSLEITGMKTERTGMHPAYHLPLREEDFQ